MSKPSKHKIKFSDSPPQLYSYRAVCVEVYDGDTIKADVDLGFNLQLKRETFRLAYIDTPEIRGKERDQGLFVRDLVRSLILDKDIIIESYLTERGKFGRYIGVVHFLDHIGPPDSAIQPVWKNLNQFLLDEGLAKPYN